MNTSDIILQVEMDVIRVLVIGLLGLFIFCAKRLLAKLGISLTADQKAELEDIADKALQYGFSQAQTEIQTHGWDHIAVKTRVMQVAAPYALQKFQQGLQRSGINTTDPVQGASEISGILNRRYAEAATVAAASPATPAANPPVVPQVAR